MTDVHSMSQLLRSRARRAADRGYTFLVDGEDEEARLTYAALDRRARAIAARLREEREPGERILLLFPPGLEFIAALFGCWHAGMVAVPAYPPDPARLARTLPRLLAIVTDAGVTLALTDALVTQMADQLHETAPQLRRLRLASVDAVPGELADAWQEPPVTGEGYALLQYTSGSVGTPRGVLLTHAQLLANLLAIDVAGGHSSGDRMLSWLPQYHDMGLIGGLMSPMYGGFDQVLMSPQAFLQRPIRWMSAASKHRVTLTVGPNFGYDLCARKAAPEELARMDLSRLRAAYNGAEPVRAETIDRFCRVFGPRGFRAEAFLPCYGLAEATLMVSGRSRSVAPPVRTVDAAALERHEVRPAAPGEPTRRLVGCGSAVRGVTLAIVDPVTRRRRAAGEVGEIWIAGASVGLGYWGRPDATDEVFRAALADTGEGPFLRTGDLGFMEREELFVTGRLKDLIVIRGRNLYPQDIEETVERVDPSMRPGSGAAFALAVDGAERLAVVQEVDVRQPAEARALLAEVRAAVAQEHGVEPYTVQLVERGTAPKTSSGKIQRHAAREALVRGELRVVAGYTASRSADRLDRLPPLPPPEDVRSAEAVEQWITWWIARAVRVRPESVDRAQPLDRFGLDSMKVMQLLTDIEEWSPRRLPETLPSDSPTIERLARFITSGER